MFTHLHIKQILKINVIANFFNNRVNIAIKYFIFIKQ